MIWWVATCLKVSRLSATAVQLACNLIAVKIKQTVAAVISYALMPRIHAPQCADLQRGTA
jgi:hypothetical protein